MNLMSPLFETVSHYAGFAPANDRLKSPSIEPVRSDVPPPDPLVGLSRRQDHSWTQSQDFDWLLLMRVALANAFGAALVVGAWALGYVDQVWAADTSGISAAIALVFLLGLAFVGRTTLSISRELNEVRRGVGRLLREPVENVKERLSGRVAVVRHTANVLVFLGLIGTVIGFIMALSGVKPDQAGDVSAIGPMVATLIQGMSVALYTTLVGSIGALWLTVMHRMLVSAASKLLCAVRVADHV